MVHVGKDNFKHCCMTNVLLVTMTLLIYYPYSISIMLGQFSEVHIAGLTVGEQITHHCSHP